MHRSHPVPSFTSLRKRSFVTAALALLVISLTGAGCARKNSPAAADAHQGHHHHTPPHGGTAVMLGNEAYHLEFVLDATTGTLTAYVLDAHMENFIRSAIPSFEVIARVAGESRSLTFLPTANSATGETVGDTSQFTAQAEWLKSTATFDSQLTALTIRGTAFSAVSFKFPEGNSAH